jgi:hypothetical protein
MKVTTLHRYQAAIVTGLVFGLSTMALRAEWGSIRANNRSEHDRVENRRGEVQPERRAEADRGRHAEFESGRDQEVHPPVIQNGMTVYTVVQP